MRCWKYLGDGGKDLSAVYVGRRVSELSPAPASLPACFSNVRWSHNSMWSGPGRCLLVPRLPRSPDCRHSNNICDVAGACPPSQSSSSFSHLSPPSLCISHNSTRRWDAQHLVQITAPFFCLHGADFYEAQLRAATKQFRHRSRVPHLVVSRASLCQDEQTFFFSTIVSV